MKKYQIVLTLFMTLLYLLWSYFTYKSFRNSKEVQLSDTNLTVIDVKKRISINSEDLYGSSFKLWDLDINKILEEREKKEHELKIQELQTNKKTMFDSAESFSNINVLKRKICLNNKCWKFMGMLTINNKTQVTLLSIDKKSRLETFGLGDELLDGLMISKIKGDIMIITHKKDEKKFILKLFDVNASAYLPKAKKEVDE